jgi:sarcosine oxidase delta subunit
MTSLCDTIRTMFKCWKKHRLLSLELQSNQYMFSIHCRDYKHLFVRKKVKGKINLGWKYINNLHKWLKMSNSSKNNPIRTMFKCWKKHRLLSLELQSNQYMFSIHCRQQRIFTTTVPQRILGRIRLKITLEFNYLNEIFIPLN